MSARLFESAAVSFRARPLAAFRVSVAIHGAAAGAAFVASLAAPAELPTPIGANTVVCLSSFVKPVTVERPPRGTPISRAQRSRAAPPLRPQEGTPAATREDKASDPFPSEEASAEAGGAAFECLGCQEDGSASGGIPGADGPGGLPSTPSVAPPRRVGGDIHLPVKTRDIVPAYPEIAKAAHIQGDVVLECVIEKDGRVTNVRVVRGMPLLDEAALAAVREWRYRPTILNGEPIAVIMNVRVSFRLPS